MNPTLHSSIGRVKYVYAKDVGVSLACRVGVGQTSQRGYYHLII